MFLALRPDWTQVVHRRIEAVMDLFGTTKALRSLEGRIAAHEERLDDLHRAMRGLKLEWEETYDKIHRLFGRIAKRTAIDAPPLVPPEPPAKTETDVMDEISAKIHARRAAGKG